MNEYEHFACSDLPMIAALVYLGFRVESLDRESGGRVSFLFEQSEELEGAKETFWKRELAVEPVGYAESIKYVKNRIYNG